VSAEATLAPAPEPAAISLQGETMKEADLGSQVALVLTAAHATFKCKSGIIIFIIM
jgi:hypothetical protein